MAADSNTPGKVGCVPIILMCLVVAALCAVWLLRGHFFGAKGDVDLLGWLGLRGQDQVEVLEEEGVAPPSTRYTVVLEEPEKDSKLLNSEEFGMGEDSGVVELSEAVTFEITTAAGTASQNVLPRGTMVEVIKREEDRLRIRLMGREGWIPSDAVTDLD
ncbi:MAG: hypothetical protein AAGK14_01055 [Verrucomicrobiota bacterium]